MLTAKQEKFVQGIIEGKSQSDAYRSAYNTNRMTDKTVWEKASKLMSDGKVKARVQELRDDLMKLSVMSAQERLEYLTMVINGEETEKAVEIVNGKPMIVNVPSALKVKLNAIDIMNKMQGVYVQKIDAGVHVEKLEDLL